MVLDTFLDMYYYGNTIVLKKNTLSMACKRWG